MKLTPHIILIALVMIVGHLPGQNDLVISGIADGAGMLFEYRIYDDGDSPTTNSAAIEFTFTF